MTNLERIRKALHLTQEALAKQAGVSDFTIRKLEHGGEPTLTIAQKLSEALNVPIRDLFETIYDAHHRMHFDYRELLALIYGKFDSLDELAQALDMTERTVRDKFFGQRTWTQEQIINLCDLLEIRYSEIPKYFFTFL